jgi:hypothetical protein
MSYCERSEAIKCVATQTPNKHEQREFTHLKLGKSTYSKPTAHCACVALTLLNFAYTLPVGSYTFPSPNFCRSNQHYRAHLTEQKDCQTCFRRPCLKSTYFLSTATRVVLPLRLCNLAYACLDVGYVPSCKYFATLAGLNSVFSFAILRHCSVLSAQPLCCVSTPRLHRTGARRHEALTSHTDVGPKRRRTLSCYH